MLQSRTPADSLRDWPARRQMPAAHKNHLHLSPQRARSAQAVPEHIEEHALSPKALSFRSPEPARWIFHPASSSMSDTQAAIAPKPASGSAPLCGNPLRFPAAQGTQSPKIPPAVRQTMNIPEAFHHSGSPAPAALFHQSASRFPPQVPAISYLNHERACLKRSSIKMHSASFSGICY